MITDAVLAEKRRVQKQMAQQAGHDVDGLAALVDTIVGAAVKEYGLQLRYADLTGGPAGRSRTSRRRGLAPSLSVAETPAAYGKRRKKSPPA